MNKSTTLRTNRTKAINKLRAAMTESAPELIARIQKGFSVKVDNTFYEKDRKDFRDILDRHSGNIQTYIRITDYNISVQFKTTYPAIGSGCCYVDQHLEIWRDNDAPLRNDDLTALDLDAVNAAVVACNELVEQINALTEKRNKLIRENLLTEKPSQKIYS